MSSDNEKEEFLRYRNMVRDFNTYGVDGVVPQFRIDEEYIYDLRYETKEIYDIVTNADIEVLLDNNERKDALNNYAEEFFKITLNKRFGFEKMLEQLFEEVILLNGMYVNDYRDEYSDRVSGFSSKDLVYALSLVNKEDVAIGENPNTKAMEMIKEAMDYDKDVEKFGASLIEELDEDTIERIIDRDFNMGA